MLHCYYKMTYNLEQNIFSKLLIIGTKYFLKATYNFRETGEQLNDVFYYFVFGYYASSFSFFKFQPYEIISPFRFLFVQNIQQNFLRMPIGYVFIIHVIATRCILRQVLLEILTMFMRPLALLLK